MCRVPRIRLRLEVENKELGTRAVESNPDVARINVINKNNLTESHARLWAYGPGTLEICP